ncbi:hypothetical protein [Lentzea cavernae]|uniref:Tryptophan-associated transmembrane protein (Trp_oprn_chp) n=1 Tax=Lentzea cavernae TaxID=2020703 RepID=A0ABQ3MIE8_9PSEU|nr:hypothetical protein [Lentzea cavernae]GHH45328.1 hypothetical protein GCM10017774_46420 [Lentzea cavernae]
MTDRRRIAGVLLVLGAVLAVVASFQPTFSSVYKTFGSGLTITTTLWTASSEPSTGGPDQPAFYAAGWPVVLSSLVIVAAVVLLLRERSAFAGRPLAAGAAGLLAGVVLLYAGQLYALTQVLGEQPPAPEQELHYHGGMYLLVAAAIIALVGAGLAQQRQTEPAPDTAADEDGVVVHQLGSDDDTPPFGIAIPNDEQQETR